MNEIIIQNFKSKENLMRGFNIFRFLLVLFFMSSLFLFVSSANDEISNVCFTKGRNNFALSFSGSSTPLYVSAVDYSGVIIALKQLQTDIEKVTDACPKLKIISLGESVIPASKEILLVGTIGKSPLIDRLIKKNKLNVKDVAKKWESFLVQVVETPFPKVDRALVIAGSDKRGTIYGIYDLSRKIGISPWYWWADVPLKKNSSLFIIPGRYIQREPKVKYRGIFINDEAPALAGMVNEKFGGFTSAFYVHVFELILRLRGNFLWPAMWDNSFSTDDTLNPKLADEYGIVMGTSHHEPMMRAWKEWGLAGNGKGSWDYSKNADSLRRFWKHGIQRSKDYEEIVTLAMRGDGDEPMSESSNIELLQNIIKDQRKILGEVTCRDVATIPQVWATYKEVQDYYDKGMRVPDDVTILMCDDNWGNIRRLPKLSDAPRSGGYGIYYHYDYVGWPRNYKWLNTNQIERTWEQMNLAYEYGVDRIWIVNVGDIKPLEFPISFFFDYAWNPEHLSAKDLPEYTRRWAEEQFGAQYSSEIAEILNSYTKFNSLRKPELLSPVTYSLVNYREAETIVAEYNDLVKKAQQIGNALPAEYKDAFYQLVLHQPSACANLNELYVTVGKNYLYAKQGRSATNSLANKAKELFLKDSLITQYYNTVLAGGKWNHMMDQKHIGYTYWQEPPINSMPEVKEINIPNKAEMGVAIEGSEKCWPNEESIAVLPEFDSYNKQNYYIEIFNRGSIPFDYSIQTSEPWIKIDYPNGKIEKEKRLFIGIDWEKAPIGKNKFPITIEGDKNSITVFAVVNNPSFPKPKDVKGFIESNSYVSIEAEDYSKAVSTSSVDWLKIPNLGRTGSAMTTMPVTVRAQIIGGESPRLEYRLYLFSNDEARVKVYFSPTQNFNKSQGLRCAVSFDDEPQQVVNIHENDTIPDWKYPRWWNQALSDNIIIKTSKHTIQTPGEHILKIWMVDPGVVLQKIVIETGYVKPSYLGPPESFNGVTKR